jgi:hypothetical protein
MEKLATARHATEQPTVAYQPAATKKAFFVRHRLLIPVLAGALLVVAAVLVKYLIFPNAPRWSGPETLLGIKIGDSDLPADLKMTQPKSLDPWAKGTPPTYLAHLLRESDLGLTPEQRQHLKVRTAPGDHATVLFDDYKVCAVVVRQPHAGRTERGLAIGAKVDQLYRLYDESPTATETVELTADEHEFAHGHVEVRRYDQLGVAFMIQKDRVIAIALYPGKSNP